MKKGDISKFIEEAVRWRIFHQTVREARAAFADVPPDELEKRIDGGCRRSPREALSGTRPTILMRAILDTNILLSALLVSHGAPASLWMPGNARYSR
jgi:hypothetical protein